MHDRLADDRYFDDLLREATAPGRWPEHEPTPGKDAVAVLRIAQEAEQRDGVVKRLVGRMLGPRPPVVRPWLVAASAAGVFAVLLGGIAGAQWVRQRTAPPVASAQLPPMLTLPDQAGLARPRLQQLSAAVAARPDHPPLGAYTVVRTRSWEADLTASGQSTYREEMLCWHSDGSARLTSVDLTPWSSNNSAIATSPDDVRTLTYPPGEYTIPVGPPSTKPEILGGQLAELDSSHTAQGVVRAVAEMYRYHALNSAQRAALLRVLADTDGVLDHGLAVDRAGRTAIAISIDSVEAGIGRRDVLLLDPTTGALLGYEQVLLSKPARVDVAIPAVASYVTYLTATRVDACVD